MQAPSRFQPGTGALLSVAVTAPAAGADWTTTVPALVRWRLISAAAQIVTSATVANRLTRLRVTRAGVIIHDCATTAIITASLTVRVGYTSNSGAFSGAVGSVVHVPYNGDLYLLAGDVVSSSTVAIDATDQWSAVALNVEEWLAP